MKIPAPHWGAGPTCQPSSTGVLFVMITRSDEMRWETPLTLSSETLDLTVGADLVVLEDGHLDLLPLVLDLLGGGLGS